MVNFRFTDQSGSKRRPAVIISTDDYHQSRVDAVLLALSTQKDGGRFGDCVLEDWNAAGLPKPTKAKGVFETISKSIIYKQIGSLTPKDFKRVQKSVRDILGL